MHFVILTFFGYLYDTIRKKTEGWMRMFFTCSCGTQVHWNRTKVEQKEELNGVCKKCFEEKKPNRYLIEYDIFPLRAIFRKQVLACSEEEAVEILLQFHKEHRITVRKIDKDT